MRVRDQIDVGIDAGADVGELLGYDLFGVADLKVLDGEVGGQGLDDPDLGSLEPLPVGAVVVIIFSPHNFINCLLLYDGRVNLTLENRGCCIFARRHKEQLISHLQQELYPSRRHANSLQQHRAL